MADFRKVGYNTPRAAIFKSESHKLHQAFPVKEGESVIQGQPVVLNTDGTIQGFKSTDAVKNIIGWAATDSINPAYKESKQHGPIEITVMVRGYAIIWGVSKAALTTGPVKPTGSKDAENIYAEYEADSATAAPIAYNLTPASAAGDLVQILVI